MPSASHSNSVTKSGLWQTTKVLNVGILIFTLEALCKALEFQPGDILEYRET